MKKVLILYILLLVVFPVFAQAVLTARLSTVGILPFETQGTGVNQADADEATRLVIAELSSWGTMNVLSGNQAQDAEYLVKGQISRANNRIVLNATTSAAGSGRALNASKEEAASLSAIPFDSFCAQIAENIPYPNYLLGKWRSTIDMIDGPVVCIMEFRSDRSIRVERFDTWEHKGSDSLKYQAIGTGSYTYAGYMRRIVTINQRQIETDATVGINLTLEDSLPKYKTVSVGGLRLLFDEAKNNLELTYGGIPCGDNYSGASVYPSANVFYTKFTKIQ